MVKIIWDEGLVKEFINKLPELESHEVYVLFLISRRKYAKLYGLDTSHIEDLVLERKVVRKHVNIDWRYRYWKNILRLSLLLENSELVYDLPNKVMGITVLMNPRNVYKASIDLQKYISDTLYQCVVSKNRVQLEYELGKLHVKWVNFLHKRPSRKLFLTIDIDTRDKNYLREVLDLLSPISDRIFHVVNTVGGYHIVLHLEGKYWEVFYREIFKRIPKGKVVEVKNDPLEPIPGTVYCGVKINVIL